MIDVRKYLSTARSFDIVGTTDLSVASGTIKRYTWAPHLKKPWISVVGRQDLASHIAVVVKGADGRWWFAEMLKTRKQVRYYDETSRQVITPEEYSRIDPKQWPQWKQVTIKSGLVLTDPMKYSRGPWGKHVVFVGRHKAFDNSALRSRMNQWIFDAFRAGKQYDTQGLFVYPQWIQKIMTVEERPDYWYCSEMPRCGLRAAEVKYPDRWFLYCSPMDWQVWEDEGYEVRTK
jgi:hypothetical protein